ncbi:ribosomal RNA small subunit methyltransferase B [Roseovarius sp. A-2]|uniref:RsmB/NOP family class I SAM-dependent RNA methyltransferase n=1 Tax=Roseovarius sp. A-2 TaxID=1570360 RepID=UPI0009B574B6|nr:RsmB/NOP family class I SAM-dependent RNA methyltransferase [Roseovarius sp. A-2]GAW33624.1 ribosomal RNA small subunit methyltransferase B [Roseovarius sp. A-2]
MKKTSHSARSAAVYLLDQVLGEGRLMSELVAGGALEALAPADRARAQRLAADTLRGLGRADRLLSKHLRKPPPLPVFNVLRAGTVELAQGGDAHGVVNEAVAIIGRHPRHNRLKGLINAVLRKMAEEAPAKWNDLRQPGLPDWLRAPLVEAWGKGPVAAMERAHFVGAPLDLTVKSDAEAWAARLGGNVLPTGSVRLREAGQVSALPGYESGAWWVQDAAAALPVQVLDPKPGERVLDLCAAPGGKTLQLAARGAQVTALDISERRMARVAENLARTGLTAACVVGDALEHKGAYDAVLLDAPCSATGTIRRHPDLPHAKDGSDFGALIELQAAMIDHALGLLATGGRLVFCTCSLLPDEGECQVEEALVRHPGLTADRAALERPGIAPEWVTEEGGLRLRPDYWSDLAGMDGFYVACLRWG